MANNEGTQNTDIIFRGTDGNECEAFVVAIRDLAFAKGKDEDPNWMLRYATTRLRGKALRWHAELDLSIRKDWDLLVQAMFKEYPFVEERDEVGIVTPVWASTTFSPAPANIALPASDRHLTTAQPAGAEVRVVPPGLPRSSSSPPESRSGSVASSAGVTEGKHRKKNAKKRQKEKERKAMEKAQKAETGDAPTVGSVTEMSPPPPGGGELVLSTPVYESSLIEYQMGRLLIIYEEGQRGPHYVSVSNRVTRSIRQALIVTFIPSTEIHQIACFDCSESKLSVNLCPYSYSGFYRLGSTSLTQDPVSMFWDEDQCFSNVWSLSPDGTLSPTLPNIIPDPKSKAYYLPSECHSTTTVYVEISGMSISFVKDHSTPRATHPHSGLPIVRARIVFEPL